MARRTAQRLAGVRGRHRGAGGLVTDDHPLDYGYGPGTPLARLLEADGKVIMIGAPCSMNLLHLADVPGKATIRYEVPFSAGDGGVQWRMVKEFDTSRPVLASLAEDYFAEIVTGFVDRPRQARHGRRRRQPPRRRARHLRLRGALDRTAIDRRALSAADRRWHSTPAHAGGTACPPPSQP